MVDKNKLKKIKDFNIELPTEEEMKENALGEYNKAAFSYLENWYFEFENITFPTKFVAWDHALNNEIFENHNPHCLNNIAAEIDRLCNWKPHFIRLNTRSPKDASYPVSPITCAGRQALMWIVSSMRCFDDLFMLQWANKPALICLRQFEYMHKEGEFRVFVKNDEVIAVTQYHYDDSFEFLQDIDTRKRIRDYIERFHLNNLMGHGLPNDFVFDLYIKPQRNKDKERMGISTFDGKLIEINPYGLSDPCVLLSYENVEKGTDDIAYLVEGYME